ncbi:glycoside hydrolase family 13 protein [Marinimicrobium alkaliphilum]|uniref:glycoside hydrolase family 13 protein n=1 Tax=Marinimicrobium alkaliphilum TaxID=2202654 RepID=UPI000DB9D82D|nr:glycoside hydrolase family 13 protein [Marinimicrobium alkaliphilum]
MKLIYSSLILLTLVLTLPAKAASIDRIDPPFWWAGMAEPSLQLMVYGDAIGDLQVDAKHDAVKVERVIPVENDNYLFVDLLINPAFEGGSVTLTFSNADGAQMEQRYEILPRREGSAQRQGLSTQDAIYLIVPDRFANADPENDTLPGMKEAANPDSHVGRHGGDIAGIIQHMDYIADMGFTAVWATPFLENDQPAYSYHGYSTTDHYRIDPRFGSNRDYQRLSEVGAGHGVKLVKDLIVNHIGDQHWWMDDLPTDDWLNFQDGFVPTTHYRTTIQDIHAADIDRKHFVDGWFVETMPDLNQRNPLMANYLIQNSIWWIEYANLKGIRADTWSYSDRDFLADWTRRLLDEYPNFTIVGEEWTPNPNTIAYWQKGQSNPDGYEAYTPSMMDFPVYYALRDAMTEEENWGEGLINLYLALADDYIYPDPWSLVIFAENHDTSRIYSYLDEDLARFKLTMTFLATMRGTPQFFYGSEVLATSPKTRADGEVRSQFPGGWPEHERNAFTGRGLSDDQASAQNHLRRLLNWRKSAAVIHDGRLLHYAPETGVYVYFRYTDDERVMVVLNKNDTDRTLDLSRFRQGLAEHAKGEDILSGEAYTLTDTITVGAGRSLVLELKR